MLFTKRPVLSFVAAVWWIMSPSFAVLAAERPTNLLPNASFELGLGQGLPTHWADILNELTIKLAADKRSVPPPEIVQAKNAPHGSMVAKLNVSEGKPHHLTSAAISLEGARSYILSAYARSGTPGARLRLCLWTRPLDWQQTPDVQSPEIELTDQWQRYEFRFIAGYRAGQDAAVGVVDLVASASAEGHVLVDAVQLEAASLISDFQPRHVVEASLSAEGKPHNGMVHKHGDPLAIDVKLYNDAKQSTPSQLEIFVADENGKVVKSHPLLEPIPPGLSDRRIVVDFGLVGQYQAGCRVRAGTRVDVADYMFKMRPVLGRDEPAIAYSLDGTLGKLPAERIDLPWENSMTWYSEPSQHLVVNPDGTIFVFTPDGHILGTSDGGRTWDQDFSPGRGFSLVPGSPQEIFEAKHRFEAIAGAMSHMSVLRDGSFICMPIDMERRMGVAKRSHDRGKTWEDIGEISKYGPQIGPVVELVDGTYICPAGGTQEGFLHSVFAFRSTDQGRTWNRYPIAPGGEPFLRQLSSGRLNCVVRFNVYPPADRYDLHLGNKWNWLFWQRCLGRRSIDSYCKNLAMLDSDDGGITWNNPREVTESLGTMHGMTVELPDGRLVLIHCSRAQPTFAGERARVSRDGGYTWDAERYYLHTTETYAGYSASCVLPPHLGDGKPGMILTIVGNRSEGNWGDGATYTPKPDHMTPPNMQAIRWRPLP